MTVHGICTTTEGTDSPSDLLDLDVPVVRFVGTPSRATHPQSMRALGKRVAIVAASETFAGFGLSAANTSHHTRAAMLMRELWGGALDTGDDATSGYVVVFNEPDDSGGASMNLPAGVLASACWSFCDVFHKGQHNRPQLVTGPLNTGQPGYLNGIVLPPCALLGLHDYDSSLAGWPAPPPAGGHHDFDSYLAVFKPWWGKMRGVAIDEWGSTRKDAGFAEQYMSRFLALVDLHPEIKLACRFPLYDRMDPSTYGLIDASGGRRPTFWQYRREIATRSGGGPVATTTFVIGQGVKDAMAKRGDVPLSSEHYIGGMPFSMTAGRDNAYLYSPESNTVYVIPKA